jgi:glycerophosphoryl diester phosphodiesterase
MREITTHSSNLGSGRAHRFLDCRGPIGFAHRGGAGEAPENTLVAFEAAIVLGYRYLETDAQLTRDGVLLAFHDDRVERVTDGEGSIAELDFADIQVLDAAYRFSPDGRDHPYRGQGLRIPRLEELMMRWPQARFNIDVKSGACTVAFVELLDRLDAWDRVCVGSVSHRRQRRLLRLGRPCFAMAQEVLALARLTAVAGSMPRLGSDCVQLSLGNGPNPFTAGFIRAAHRAGLPVHAWTVNEEAVMHELLDLGVDGIMTDRPRLLCEVFAQRGLDIAGSR